MIASSRFDVPSLYELSAHDQGRPPKQAGLWKGNLLLQRNGLVPFTLKYANEAQATIVLGKLQDFDRTDKNKDFLIEMLRTSYVCFLRLNCPIKDGMWHSQQFKRDVSSGSIKEVEALCESYKKLYISKADSSLFRSNDWESKFWLLGKAVKRCNTQFPNIALYFNTLKRKKKKKNDLDNTPNEQNGNQNLEE